MDGGDIPRIDIRVIRIREPRTIADPRIKALIMRAVVAATYRKPEPQAVYGEIVENIASEGLGVFVGFDGWQCVEGQVSKPLAIAVVTLPSSAIAIGPLCPLVYSEDRRLSRLVGARVREFVKKAGYDHILGFNFLHDDESYERVFRHVGESVAIGSVIQVRL